MSEFEQPDSYRLTLNSEHLSDLQLRLAQALILHGDIESNPGVFAVTKGEEPRTFTATVDPEIVHQLFYPEQDDVGILTTEVSYSTPYKLEPDDPPDEAVNHSVVIRIEAALKGTLSQIDQLKIITFLQIGCRGDNEGPTGYIDSEYIQKGKRVSPNDETPIGLDEFTPLIMRGFVDDQEAYQRALGLREAERIESLIAVLSSKPSQ